MAVDGQTAREMSVSVVRSPGGNLVYELTDWSEIKVHAPGQGEEFELALFADVPAGIEPDPSSYPHSLLGVWAWNGEAGAFWDASPAVPPAAFGNASPRGMATYSGDVIGLLAAGSAVTKFQADFLMVADFSDNTVSGEVAGIRSLAGAKLGNLSVALGKTVFSEDGSPFSGASSAGTAGGGRWGARWSDGAGNAVGGSFGFAADDGSIAVLGAFSAGLRTASDSFAGSDDDPISIRSHSGAGSGGSD